MSKNGKKNTANTNPTNRAQRTAAPVTSGESGTRVRLANDSGMILMFTKKVGKNGAIRVSATISQKGHKPQKVGRETFSSHADANKGMDVMVAAAAEKGWTLRAKSSSYTGPSVDKVIEIPGASEVASSEKKDPKTVVVAEQPVVESK